MSGINDGQRVRALESNAAWLAKNGDDTAVGIVTLSNNDPASGASVPNVQGAINNVKTFTGQTNTLDTSPTYSSTNYVSGSLEDAIGDLDAQVKTNADNIATNTGDISTLDVRVDVLEANAEYETTATSAGTKNLTVSSDKYQVFTGSSNHTVNLPNASTLILGTKFEIVNRSTGAILVNSASTDLTYLRSGQRGEFTLNSTTESGTCWNTQVSDFDFYDKSLIETTSTTASGTKTLDWDSRKYQRFTGTATGYKVLLPLLTESTEQNAQGVAWIVRNESSQSITVRDAGDITTIKTVIAGATYQFLIRTQGGTDWIATNVDADVLNISSLTLNDNAFTLQDNSDTTKKAVFELSGITTGQTRTITLPDASFTPATLDTTQTFTGAKTFTDNLFTLQDNSDNTKKAVFELSGITTGTTRTVTLADANIEIGKAPTVQRFTSGSGTYTTPAGVRYIVVEMVGAGGGGGGSGTTAGTAATAGGNTTFGSSLLTANGGAIGAYGTSGSGGAGGTATVNSPAVTLHALTGGRGQGSQIHSASPQHQLHGGQGGANPLGGAGGGGTGQGAQAGQAGEANTGAGGGGAGMNIVASGATGSGGGAGAYIKAMIASPSASYAYAVGAGGNGQAAGTSGNAGGNGGSGVIVVTEYYN